MFLLIIAQKEKRNILKRIGKIYFSWYFIGPYLDVYTHTHTITNRNHARSFSSGDSNAGVTSNRGVVLYFKTLIIISSISFRLLYLFAVCNVLKMH